MSTSVDLPCPVLVTLLTCHDLSRRHVPRMELLLLVASCLIAAARATSPVLSLNVYTADGKFEISLDGRAWLKGGEYQVPSYRRHCLYDCCGSQRSRSSRLSMSAFQ